MALSKTLFLLIYLIMKLRIFFANAIYFKGSWAVPFSDWMTDTFDFHLLNDEKVQVSFMSYYMKQAFINVCDGFKVLKLPYDTCQLISMYILLPDAKDGLPSLVDKLATGTGFLEHLHIPIALRDLASSGFPNLKCHLDSKQLRL